MLRSTISLCLVVLCTSCGGGGNETPGAMQPTTGEDQTETGQVAVTEPESPAVQPGNNGPAPYWCFQEPISRIYSGDWTGTLTSAGSEPTCQYEVVMSISSGPVDEKDNLNCETNGTMRVETTLLGAAPFTCQEFTDQYDVHLLFPEILGNLTLDISASSGFILSSDLPDPIQVIASVPDEDEDNFPPTTGDFEFPFSLGWGFFLNSDASLTAVSLHQGTLEKAPR